MGKANKICQSCGMPLNRDEKGGGSNSDGSINLAYCSFCYSDGAFTSPDITLGEMKARVKEKMKELGFPGLLASFFTWNISRLERWK